MALRPFNSVAGITVGENPETTVILANGDITTINFTANGVSNLGPISNVIVTGGSSGQVIQTDGSGNLSFTSVSTTSISNGNSNVTIPTSDGDVYINANSGVDWQWTFGANGFLTLPSVGGQPAVIDTVAGDIDIFTGNGGVGYAEIWLQEGSNVLINTAGGLNSWVFDTTGNFIAPNDINAYSFTSNAGVVDFTTASNVALGDIANVHILGGVNGQVLQTDGLGNLTFTDQASANSAAPMPYIIPVGESYLVPSNFQGLFTVPIEIEGTLEVDGILAEVGTAINSDSGQIIFDDNGELTGNAGFTFDTISGNLSVPGSGTFTGNLLPSANIIYDLGSPTQRWKDLYLANNTIYIGNSTISGAGGNLALTNSSGGEFVVAGNATVSTLENGNSNISINANANITVSVNGTSNVAVFSSNTFNVTGNVIATGVKTDNLYYANGSPWDLGGNPGGSNTQIQFNNDNEFGASANLTFNSSTNLLTVTGNIAANNANLGNAATANYLFATAGSLTLGNSVIAVSGTTGGIFASTLTDLNIGLVANIVMGSSSGNVTVQGNLKSNGGVTGTTLTGSLTTAAQPNVTSVGTLSNLSVSGNINTGNITVTNTVDAVNIKVTDLFSKRSSIGITTNTVIDTFPTSAFRSAKYTMRAGDGYDYQALEVLLVHNDINSIITVYGSLSTSGTDLVLFTTDISAGNVNVYATAVGPGTDLNLMGTYVPD